MIRSVSEWNNIFRPTDQISGLGKQYDTKVFDSGQKKQKIEYVSESIKSNYPYLAIIVRDRVNIFNYLKAQTFRKEGRQL